MLKMKQTLSVFLVITMILSSSIVFEGATSPFYIAKATGRSFSIEQGQLEEYESSEVVEAKDINLDIEGAIIDLTLELENDVLNFQLELFPSQFGPYKGNTVIGVSTRENLNYNIVNFRIEKNANSIALMKENLFLTNATVLFLALRSVSTNEIFYFQIELKNFDFEVLLEAANTQFTNSMYTVKDMEMIEVSYLTMNSTKSVRSLNSTTFTKTGTISKVEGNIKCDVEDDTLSDTLNDLKEMCKNGLINVNTRASSLINGVPDEIYKKGAFDEWQSGFNGWGTKTGYEVYTTRYGGTDNRFNYVMTFSIPQTIDWDDQIFDIGFRITNNCVVLYNVYTQYLGVFDSSAYITVDANVHYASNSYNGVFTRRYYTSNKNSYELSNITKVIVGYVPYLADIAYLYEELTASSATTTNKVYPYGDNIEAQASEGKIVREVGVCEKGLKQKTDFLYMKLNGSKIEDVDYGYKYTCYAP